VSDPERSPGRNTGEIHREEMETVSAGVPGRERRRLIQIAGSRVVGFCLRTWPWGKKSPKLPARPAGYLFWGFEINSLHPKDEPISNGGEFMSTGRIFLMHSAACPATAEDIKLFEVPTQRPPRLKGLAAEDSCNRRISHA
jgi:hypothetical protein